MTNTLLLWIIILLDIVRSSHQTIYSCNVNASCGCSTSSTIVTRIVGGEEANIASWGWVVSIAINNTYLCSGSILSSSWVITAAHCVKDFNASQITIYAGSNFSWYGSQTKIVSYVTIHPEYNSTIHTNDIALLLLSSPLIMTNYDVSAICLKFINSKVLANLEWPPPDTTVVTVGWGRLYENGLLPTNLQQVT
ncbi:unnamed protein product [Rotaria sp. Silwood1]|nr:unnamed protein product [Rotaria sp. Silwood1]